MTPQIVRPGLSVLAITLALLAGSTLSTTSAVAAPAAPVASAVRADTSDFTFASFDADYDLARDAEGHSTLRTVETIVANFPETDQNRGIERAIPNWYGDSDLGVAVTGVTDETGTPVAFVTSVQDEFTVLAIGTDEFVHGPTTYVIEYTQQDVVGNFDDTNADEFYWDVNGTGWGQPFERVTARLHVDKSLTDALTGEASCYVGYYGTDAACTIENTPDAGGTVLTATSPDLAVGQSMSIAVGFTSGFFTLPPGLDESWNVTVAPLLILGLAALAILTLLVMRTFVWRDAKGRGIIIPQYTPPRDQSVMLAAAFLGREKVGLPAQLITFAVSRAARLVESPSEPAHRRYSLEVLDRGRLAPADLAILDALAGAQKSSSTLRLDTQDKKLGDRIARLDTRISNQVESSGLRARGTSLVLTIAVVTLIVDAVAAGLVLWWAERNEVSNGLLGVMLLGIVVALVLLIFIGRMPNRLTEKGALHLEYLLGLREYLTLAEADRLQMLQSPEGAERISAAGLAHTTGTDLIVKLHEKLLPWAVLWGVEREWADELGGYYATTDASPDWYSGVNGAAFSGAFYGFSHSFSTASFSTSSSDSSGSDSSWSGSGGSSSSGGSSGGGFSGGGGGGGGGDGL